MSRKVHLKDINYKIIRKSILILLWITVITGSVSILAGILINFPAIQNRITDKIEKKLSKQTGAEFNVNRINIRIPDVVKLKGIYIGDRQSDTLAYIGELNINANLFALLKHSIELDEVEISDARAHMERSRNNGNYNFQFIIDSLSGNAKSSTEKQSWKFNINRLLLKRVHFVYDDRYTGRYGSFDFGRLNLTLRHIDIGKLDFNIRAFAVRESNITYRQLSSGDHNRNNTENNGNTTSANLTIHADRIELYNNSVRYADLLTGSILHIGSGKFLLEDGSFSLQDHTISVSGLHLAHNFVEIKNELPKFTNDSIEIGESGNSKMGNQWQFSLNRLVINDNAFRFNDRRYPHARSGFDPHHFYVCNVYTEIHDIQYGKSLHAGIASASLEDGSGMEIRKLSGSFFYSPSEVRLHDFTLKTAQSDISGSHLRFNNYQEPKDMMADVDISGSFNTSDVAYGIPGLKKYLKHAMQIRIATSLKKEGRHIRFDKFNLLTGNFSSQVRGSISDWTSLDSIKTDSLYIQLKSGKTGLDRIVPVQYLPRDLILPEKFQLDLYLSGKFDNLRGLVDFTSTLGDLHADIKQDSMRKGDSTCFNAELKVRNVKLGKIIQDEEAGIVNTDLSITANARLFSGINGKADGTINSLEYAGFDYRDIQYAGHYRNRKLFLQLSGNQPELIFRFNGHLEMQDSLTSAGFHLNLEKAVFDSLNVGPRHIIAHGIVDADLDSIREDHLNGKVALKNIALIKGSKLYRLDSMIVTASSKRDISELKVGSDLLDFYLSGNVPLVEIPGVLHNYTEKYLNAGSNQADLDSAYHFRFDLNLHRNDILSGVILPKLHRLDVETFNGELDVGKKLFNLDISVPDLQYGSFGIRDFTTHIRSGKDHIDGQIKLSELDVANMSVADISLNAVTENERVSINLEIPKQDSSFLYLKAEAYRENGYLVIHLPEDGFHINGRNWNVNPDNRLIFASPLRAEEFELSLDNQLIRIGKPEDQSDTVLVSATMITCKNFRLSSIGAVFLSNKPLFDGILNASLIFTRKNRFPSGKVNIDSLDYREVSLGNLNAALHVMQTGLKVDLVMTPGNGKMTVSGIYTPEKAGTLDFNIDFETFDLKTFKPLTSLVSKTFNGNLDGRLSVTGTASEPLVSGNLKMNHIEVFPDYLNTWFYADNEVLHFRDDNIFLDNFTIQDAEKHEATINGTVGTNGFNKINLDLSFKSNDFTALNTTESSNKLYYGKVIIDSDVKLSGSLELLHIKGSMVLDDGSKVNIVIPATAGSVIQREGLVQFVSRDEKKNPFEKSIKKLTTNTVTQTISGYDIQANIEIHENSHVVLIVDQQSGDHLSLQGEGNFSFRLHPEGNMELTGQYNISDGLYYLNFHQLVKRQFDILSGSYILWTGDPSDAELHIQARYQLETQIPTPGKSNRLPVNVNLNINGNLLKPDLNFNLSLPEETSKQYGQAVAYVNNINSDESELNKQIMSLVLFKSFITSQTSSGVSGTVLSNTARSSISKFLTQQLNRISPGIEGMNLNLNLQSYEKQNSDTTASGVTNLEVGLSQSLFNNRLTFKISGNVYLENSQQQSRSLLDHANDVSLEYDLTTNGNFQLIGFRENEYNGLSQGDIIRTGVGVIFSKDYDYLHELFRNKRKDGVKPEVKGK